MFPGLTTKLSEQTIALSTTIAPKADLVRVTSTAVTTVVATIVPPFGGFSGIIVLVNDSGNPINLVTTGNIELAVVALLDNASKVLVFSKLSGKWYPHSV